MSIIAAFLWTKSPRTSISTMILHEDNLKLLSAPKIQYLPKKYFSFQIAVVKIIKEFFKQIEIFQRNYKANIVIEFRILFNVEDIAYLAPAKESKFVYKVFQFFLRKTKNKFKSIKVRPQLRKRLSGKSLINFKKELRSLYLVSRKKDTGFEYHLWAVALHATSATYAIKLQRIRSKLKNAMWNETLIKLVSNSVN